MEQIIVASKGKSRVILILAGLFIIWDIYHWWGFSYFDPIDLFVRIATPLPALGIFWFKTDSNGYRISKILFIIILVITVLAGPIIDFSIKYLGPAIDNSLIGKLGKQALEK